MNRSNEHLSNDDFQTDSSAFRPTLRGCVARDTSLAMAVCRCYIHTFSSIALDIYHSLACEKKSIALCDLFEELARCDLEQFRLVSELLLALGGEEVLCDLRGKCERAPLLSRSRAKKSGTAIQQAIAMRKQIIDYYQTLMSRTQDRVARSVFAKLLATERRMLDALEHAEKMTENCF